MKPILIYVIVCSMILLNYSCKKESETTKFRLLNVTKNTWEGSNIVAVYNYDELNRLRDIKHLEADMNFIEIFNYSADGRLLTYENDYNRYSKKTFYYSGDKLDYLVVSYTNNDHVKRNDTIVFSYDQAGNISQQVHRNKQIYSQYFYTCDEKGRIITMMYGAMGDSTWYTWSTEGNLTKKKVKSRDIETGAYNTYVSLYEYDSGINFMNSIPYPAAFRFITSLWPSTMESRNNCISGPLYNTWWLRSGPYEYSYYNSAGYPDKIKSGETIWDLVYGEYQP